MAVFDRDYQTTYHPAVLVDTGNNSTFNPQVPGSNPGGVTQQKPYSYPGIRTLAIFRNLRILRVDDKTDDKTVSARAETGLCATRRRAPPIAFHSSLKCFITHFPLKGVMRNEESGSANNTARNTSLK